MPLAGDVGVVAGVLQQLRHRERAVVQEALVARQAAPLVVRRAHGALADQVVVGAGDQHRAGDGADRAGVVVGQDAAARGQGVEVRRRDLSSVGADVGIAEVVGHDEQQVGPPGRRTRRVRSGVRRGRGQRIGRAACAVHAEQAEARERQHAAAQPMRQGTGRGLHEGRCSLRRGVSERGNLAMQAARVVEALQAWTCAKRPSGAMRVRVMRRTERADRGTGRHGRGQASKA